MAALTVQIESLGGTELTGNAANAGGDTFVNDGKTRFIAQNDDASPTTITFVTSQTITSEALAVGDMAVAVTNAKVEVIGPFPIETFGTTVSVTYSSVTSLTVDVIKQAG